MCQRRARAGKATRSAQLLAGRSHLWRTIPREAINGCSVNRQLSMTPRLAPPPASILAASLGRLSLSLIQHAPCGRDSGRTSRRYLGKLCPVSGSSGASDTPGSGLPQPSNPVPKSAELPRNQGTARWLHVLIMNWREASGVSRPEARSRRVFLHFARCSVAVPMQISVHRQG